MLEKYQPVFFCDNCSAQRLSLEHRERITKDGYIIIRDKCAECLMTQEIEIHDGDNRIKTHRIKNDEGEKK